MAPWHRAMADRPCRISLLYRTWYNSLGCPAMTPAASGGGGWPVSSKVLEDAGGARCPLRDGVRYMAARFFAAPVPARKKEDPRGMQGPRLNEAITAKFIRLVNDEGHAIVPREEALDRARKLDLDLVEVQRTAKPPVCKIMDYHKEKYKKETNEKERAKSKSESTIRKGDFKEVRLKGKIEQKDIEVKAETIKGLIERGYRVKCMALPSKQKGTEECDLGALLSRLTDLIEDVIIIESGPFVEKQQAYVVVRHVKFGSKKGSQKKATKTVEGTSGIERAASSSPIAFDSATVDAEAAGVVNIDEESEDEILSDAEMDVQDIPGSAATSPLMFDSGSNRNVGSSGLTGKSDSWGAMVPDVIERSPASKTVYDSLKANLGSERDQIYRHVSPKPSISRPEFSAEDSNRYSKRIDMKFRADQTRPVRRNGTGTGEKVAPEHSGFSSTNESNKFRRSPGLTNPRWVEQQRSNQGDTIRQTPVYETQKREHADLKQGRIPPNDTSPVPSYGIFSSSKSFASDAQRMADVKTEKQNPLGNNNNEPNIPKSKVETTGRNNDKTKQGGWGILSRPIQNPSQDNSFGQR